MNIKYFETKISSVLKIYFHHCNIDSDSKPIHKNYFYAQGECKNSLCTKFTFTVVEPINKPFKFDIIKVNRKKAIKHDPNEPHRRQIKRKARAAMAMSLKGSFPKRLKLGILGTASVDALESGNFNKNLDVTVLKKISSTNKIKANAIKNIYADLLTLISDFEEKWPSVELLGYIENYQYKPFLVICFTERQMRLILQQKNPVFLNLDGKTLIENRPTSLVNG